MRMHVFTGGERSTLTAEDAEYAEERPIRQISPEDDHVSVVCINRQAGFRGCAFLCVLRVLCGESVLDLLVMQPQS